MDPVLGVSVATYEREIVLLPGIVDAGERFGERFGAGGDVDGDGVPDVIVGSSMIEPTLIEGEMSGLARVYSGADGSTLHTIFLAPMFGYGGWGEVDQVSAVSIVGDVNADGFDDFTVSSQDFMTVEYVKVFSGEDGSLLHLFEQSPAIQETSPARGVGDMNGDGHDDLLLGNLPATLVSGATGEILRTFVHMEGDDMFWGETMPLGDIDGDGLCDFAITSPYHDGIGEESGRLHVVSGADGSVLFQLKGSQAGETYGSSVTGMGDLDGDGFNDLIVGAEFTDNASVDVGRVIALRSCSGVTDVACTGAPNSTGASGTLIACNRNTSYGDLSLRADRLPVGSYGYFLVSPAAGSTPVGAGQLCLGPPAQRLLAGNGAVCMANPDGFVHRTVDLANLPASNVIQPGETWYFQYLHRDVDANGLQTVQLTDAVSVTFP
tara:strand:+ start:36353 stop:37660 length:1308 start_codon:yes stop_codon:yes gene_type:complete